MLREEKEVRRGHGWRDPNHYIGNPQRDIWEQKCRSGRSSNIEFLHPGLEGGWLQAEYFGSTALAADPPIGRFESSKDVGPFDFGKC